MKRILTLLAVSVCAFCFIVSCGNDKTPVDEFLALLEQRNNLGKQLETDQINWDEYKAQINDLDAKAEKFVEDNKTYELTDEDRDKIFEFALDKANKSGKRISSSDQQKLKETLKMVITLEDFYKIQ